MSNKRHSILYRFSRIIRQLFIPSLFAEEQELRKQQEDYEYLISRGVETEPGYVRLCGLPIIQKHPQAHIVIGKGVTLVSEPGYNEAGVNHPVILAAMSPCAQIMIHDRAGLSGTSVVAEEKIEIGEDAMLGANTNIYDNDFHPVNAEARIAGKKGLSAPVKIGKRCWLASNVTVLKGVTIGNETVVGAMSLVVKDLPANVVAGGVPAHVIHNIDENE